MPRDHEFVLTLACRDTRGIVHAVSGLLYEAGCNIIDSQQFGDLDGDDATGLFFMRVHVEAPAALADVAALERLLAPTRERFAMQATVSAVSRRARLLLMVSRHGHCLNDLLFRWKSGQLARRHPRHRVQPRRLRAARGDLRHRVPPPPASGRTSAHRSSRWRRSSMPSASTSSFSRATCRS